MNPVMVYPNVERLLVDYLDPFFTVPVRTDVPNPRPDAFIRVRRVGGPARVVTDAALVTVESWAANPTPAYTQIAEVRARIEAMAYTTQSGVDIYRITELGGPANLPDPDSSQARYTLTVQIVLRGAPLA